VHIITGGGMTDRVMGIIFIVLMSTIILSGMFLMYATVGAFFSVCMFLFLYLWSGFLIWIVCLPESGEWKYFMGLLVGWYFAVIWKAIILNGE